MEGIRLLEKLCSRLLLSWGYALLISGHGVNITNGAILGSQAHQRTTLRRGVLGKIFGLVLAFLGVFWLIFLESGFIRMV